jgi:hypothetical protein
MRVPVAVLLVLALGFLMSCRTRETVVSEVDPGPPGRQELEAAILEVSRNGSFQAEALLIAAGPAVEAETRLLLASSDPDVRRRATLVLLSTGSDLPLTPEEQVDLALFEIMRTDGQPWSRLSGLLRLDRLGESAGAGLEEEASGGGDRAAVAQRLLRQRAEAK